MSGLYNPKIYQDVFLNFDNTDWSNLWNTPGFLKYLKFITVNFGLNGLLMYATPRAYIEGFTDPLVYTLSQMPVYEGGDQTISPVLAIDSPPTHPPNCSMAFFTGEDDHALTRSYGLWLNQTEIKIQAYDYYSISKVIEADYDPWMEPAVISGTDGMQFQPNLSEDMELTVFVNDLSRAGGFDYTRSDTETYPHLESMIFSLS